MTAQKKLRNDGWAMAVTLLAIIAFGVYAALNDQVLHKRNQAYFDQLERRVMRVETTVLHDEHLTAQDAHAWVKELAKQNPDLTIPLLPSD